MIAYNYQSYNQLLRNSLPPIYRNREMKYYGIKKTPQKNISIIVIGYICGILNSIAQIACLVWLVDLLIISDFNSTGLLPLPLIFLGITINIWGLTNFVISIFMNTDYSQFIRFRNYSYWSSFIEGLLGLGFFIYGIIMVHKYLYESGWDVITYYVIVFASVLETLLFVGGSLLPTFYYSIPQTTYFPLSYKTNPYMIFHA